MLTFFDQNTTMNSATVTPNNRFLVTSDYVHPDTLTSKRTK